MALPASIAPAARYVGASVKRVEDPAFLTGSAHYVDDIELPRMLHAAFLRSHIGHGVVSSIDASQAETLDGVHLVLTGRDLAALVGPICAPQGSGLEGITYVPRSVLATDRVRFVGEALAIVVAESRYVAEDALERIVVEWEELPAVADIETALAPGAPTLHAEAPGNDIGMLELSTGDPDERFAAAAQVFSKRLRSARQQAAPLEARGSIAAWDRATGRLTLWTSSQAPHLVKSWLTTILGLPEGRCRVITPAVGGGFGNKSQLVMEDIALVCASRRLGRPVKWIEDRVENIAASTHGKETICELEIALDEDARITAVRGRYVGDIGAYTIQGPSVMVDTLRPAALITGVYDVPSAAWSARGVLTNKCWSAAYRGVGMSGGQAARELLIDEAARAIGIDPLELRLRNVIPPDPGYVTATGLRLDGGSYGASLRRAAEMLGYEAFRERQRRLRAEGRHVGVGFSPYIEPTGCGTAISVAFGMPRTFLDASSVTVQPDGSVTVRSGLQSHGQSHETTFAQVAADALGVKLESVRVVEGDTETTPYGMGSYASRSAVVGGGSIMRAAADVRAKLIDLAAHLLEADPRDVTIEDGQAHLAGAPEPAIPVAEIARFAYFGGAARPPGIEPALTATRTYDPAEAYSNGCVAAVVEVDAETGLVRVDEVVAVEDCGTVINPMVVDGQVAGGIAQGIGSALLEEIAYAEDGQLLTSSLMDYLYPSSMEVPPMRIEHLVTPSDVTEGGIKGAGEGGTIAAPAAVLCAIADALSPFGITIDRSPAGPSDLLAAIRGSRVRDSNSMLPGIG